MDFFDFAGELLGGAFELEFFAGLEGFAAHPEDGGRDAVTDVGGGFDGAGDFTAFEGLDGDAVFEGDADGWDRKFYYGRGFNSSEPCL